MTDAGSITIIIDDTEFFQVPGGVDPREIVGRVVTTQGIYPSRYNDTSLVLDFTLPFLLYPFDGSSVQLYGIAPPQEFNQTFVVFIYAPLSQEYSYHAPAYGGLHYTSPPDADISNLQLAHVLGVALDYAVVTVHPTADLLGTTILVDDSSSSLIWRGSWTEENNFTLAVGCLLPFTPTSASNDSDNITHFTCDMAPHASTTHASQTKGDEFEFWFTGTSISVYGVTPSQADSRLPPWLLQMSFTLDTAEPIMVNITSQEFVYEQPHVVYFNASNIPAGNHSVVGRVVDVVGSALPRARIDYITYKPSFASQAEMPVLPPFAPTPTATSSTTIATSSTTIATSSTSPTSSSEAASGGGAKVKIISGAVVGSIVLCAVAVALVVYMRRRQRKNRSRYQVEEPFLGSSESDGYSIPVGEKRGTMRLRHDAVGQEPRTEPQEPVHAGPPAARNVSQLPVDTPAVHGDELEQLPVAAPHGNPEMDSRFRELQTQVQQLRQETVTVREGLAEWYWREGIEEQTSAVEEGQGIACQTQHRRTRSEEQTASVCDERPPRDRLSQPAHASICRQRRKCEEPTARLRLESSLNGERQAVTDVGSAPANNHDIFCAPAIPSTRCKFPRKGINRQLQPSKGHARASGTATAIQSPANRTVKLGAGGFSLASLLDSTLPSTFPENVHVSGKIFVRSGFQAAANDSDISMTVSKKASSLQLHLAHRSASGMNAAVRLRFAGHIRRLGGYTMHGPARSSASNSSAPSPHPWSGITVPRNWTFYSAVRPALSRVVDNTLSHATIRRPLSPTETIASSVLAVKKAMPTYARLGWTCI
ncbi:hypothetical protein C8F01DRAFT_1233429 [Mycena amicta]|nr:hypothetical protein C8F01DRAFT_1233429 [Mycena amicta]